MPKGADVTETLSTTYSETKTKVTDNIKGFIFDILGAAVVISAFLLSLGALEIIYVTWETLGDIVIDFLPYYFAAVLLANNYYTKGLFKGKSTQKYEKAITAYSKIAADLNGHQMQVLADFCQQYNREALERMQSNILHKVAIDFEIFDKPYELNDKQMEPLKVVPKNILLTMYNKDVVRVIEKAKRAKVVGINENVLLSSIKTKDETDLGKNEAELQKSQRCQSGLVFFITMFAMSFVGFKDVQQWGWNGAALTLYKMIWILVKSYAFYFQGYNSVVVNLVAYITRKEDTLKKFDYWYTCKYPEGDISKNIS